MGNVVLLQSTKLHSSLFGFLHHVASRCASRWKTTCMFSVPSSCLPVLPPTPTNLPSRGVLRFAFRGQHGVCDAQSAPQTPCWPRNAHAARASARYSGSRGGNSRYTRSNARLRALREHFEASMVSTARSARRRHHAGFEMRNAAHLDWEDLGAGDSTLAPVLART